MQRILTFLIILFAALHGGCATATKPAPVTEARTVFPPGKSIPAEAQPAPQAAETMHPATTAPASQADQQIASTSPLIVPPPPSAVVTIPLREDVKPLPSAVVTIPLSEDAKPHLALLLPLKSASFGPAAEAVRQGAVAAAIMQAPTVLPLKTYPTDGRVEDIVSAYRQAVQAGARVVIGPLTRNAVTALAESGLISVPTLALNSPEADIPLPEKLYLFGLSAEGEARQAAQLAFNDGRRTALTVTANTPLAKRVQQAFADIWRALGGKLVAQVGFSTDRDQFPALRETVQKHPADMIFLTADADLARLVRPYLDANIPTYATSMVFGGKQEISRNIDLNGVFFVEMPWFLLPDNPAVMGYPRAEDFSIEQDRLYALGIDAYRLASLMAQQPLREGYVLDGVTGQISLSARQFTREMAIAQFRQGEAVAIEFAEANKRSEPK